jgi:Txe/YoeB family toxin of Txe-Axe toxin-antitoxin module
MSYAVSFSPEADEDFDRMAAKDPLLASHVLDEIDRLAEDPRGLSLPPSLPHLLYPRYECWGRNDDRSHRIIILFRYTARPNEIEIVGIGHVEYA